MLKEIAGEQNILIPTSPNEDNPYNKLIQIKTLSINPRYRWEKSGHPDAEKAAKKIAEGPTTKCGALVSGGGQQRYGSSM